MPADLRGDVAIDLAFLLRRRTVGALHHVRKREEHIVKANRIVERDLIHVRMDLDQ